jgi:hypothetical protein
MQGQAFWKQSLSWLPSEASLFGAIDFKSFGSLSLDDPVPQAALRLFLPGRTVDRLTPENLGRIRIDGLSLAYYEETKTEHARVLVHLDGLALDGRKRILDFIRRDNADKVTVEEKNLDSATGRSARISGPALPFALGMYDDQHFFLAQALNRQAKQDDHVKALEHLRWFVFSGGKIPSRSLTDILSGYNPPWITTALGTIPSDACAVFIGEIPLEGRKYLTETLSLRACPRTFVFHMRRQGEGVVVSLTLNVDKAGGELLLLDDLDAWRKQAVEVLSAKFPAVKKEREELALVEQTLKSMRWGANPGSRSVRTQVQIPDPTWKALREILKRIAQANVEEQKER